MNIYGIIMAGGEGTRFWPLSRRKKPKQLLNLSGRDLMVNEAVARLATVAPRENIVIVTNRSQAEIMKEAVGGRIPAENILPEPAARNTAACIGFAAVKLLKRYGDGVMAVTPSDAYIRDERAFTETLGRAIRAAEEEEKLVTVGIRPTFPATGYGYIRYEKSGAPVKKAVCFVEKPDADRAKAFLESGDYLWNSGIFVWKISVILEKFRLFLPEMYALLMEIYRAADTEEEARTVRSVYPALTSVSIDCGIMEKCDGILVVPGEFGWSDVGSWDMLGAIHAPDADGNVVVGDGIVLGAENSVLYSDSKPIVAVGVDGLVIVNTPDAVLVCPKDRVQDVKKVVEKLTEQGREELL